MTTITVIHEIRLSSETALFLRELVTEFARGATPTGTRPAPPNGATDAAEFPGNTASVAQPDPPGDARPAGDEPAIVDVSSPPSSAPAAVLPAGNAEGTCAAAAKDETAAASFFDSIPVREMPRQWTIGEERTVLDLIGKGRSNAQIGDTIGRTAYSVAERIQVMRERGERVPARPSGYLAHLVQTGAPRKATHEQVLRWANERGLCSDGNLNIETVNAKARELGLPVFELRGKGN